MSSLIPERQIVISPSLATTIGLEEAVLLQVLNDASVFGTPTIKNQYHWFSITGNELLGLLPFWDQPTTQRVINNLQAKGIILLDSKFVDFDGQLCFAMNDVQQTPAPQPRARTQLTHKTRGASLIDKQWQPDEELLQLMTLNHNIPKDFALGQRDDFVVYWHERQQVSHSWSSKFMQHVLREWRHHQSRQAKTSNQQDINNQWRPSPEALEILHRANVTAEFIEDAIPEFVLYWGERGEASSTWNSKFIAHIRRQWAKYTKTLELDYEPKPIAANWQPSEDVYDILKMANIDIAFARQLVPEFVLFWRDTQQIQRSWNTKFLQHVKYQWATRHHMEQNYARAPITDQPAQRKDQSPFQQLTDRSWATGMVEGLK